MARLVAAGVKLRDQVNKRFPSRDKASDGWLGDRAHKQRISDHNADAKGWVHALDIDADLVPWSPRLSKRAARALADQLVDYARSGEPGSDRLKYVVFDGRIASGSYRETFWIWRGSGYGHHHHIHVSFTDVNPVTGRRPFPLEILGK